jgi:NTE family protein
MPFFFPAVRMNREYFGDGALRQSTPLSPAIHLGADRLLVIGEGRMSDEGDEREPGDAYPSPARIAAQALAGMYVDALTADLEHAGHINHALQPAPAEGGGSADDAALRPLRVLSLAPSARLDHLATEHVGALPRSVQALLSGMGATGRDAGALASYLLFEPPYTRDLIELGHRDTLARADEVRGFLDSA